MTAAAERWIELLGGPVDGKRIACGEGSEKLPKRVQIPFKLAGKGYGYHYYLLLEDLGNCVVYVWEHLDAEELPDLHFSGYEPDRRAMPDMALDFNLSQKDLEDLDDNWKA